MQCCFNVDRRLARLLNFRLLDFCGPATISDNYSWPSRNIPGWIESIAHYSMHSLSVTKTLVNPDPAKSHLIGCFRSILCGLTRADQNMIVKCAPAQSTNSSFPWCTSCRIQSMPARTAAWHRQRSARRKLDIRRNSNHQLLICT